jgi:hypothetical protein
MGSLKADVRKLLEQIRQNARELDSEHKQAQALIRQSQELIDAVSRQRDPSRKPSDQ